MSATEIIESQMNDMRREIAEANKQIGQIRAYTESLGKTVDAFVDGDIGQHIYTDEQYKSMILCIREIFNACKRV